MIETKFKHTDIGPVPKEWEVKTLSEVGSFSKGRGISRAESNSGKLPAVRYGELYTDHNDYIKKFRSYISTDVAKGAKLIHKGDILFAASGETKEDIGKSVAFINDFDAYAGGDIIILSPQGNYDPIYLGFISNSKLVQSQKASRGQGDAVVHIVTSDLGTIQIPLPPLPEQRRIASALMKVDGLIANLDKLIAKKQAIKKGAMQELLTGKKRLPGFKGEWKDSTIGDIAQIVGGGTPSTEVDNYWNGDIQWFTPAELSDNNKYAFKSIRTISKQGVRNSSAKILPINTILLTSRASIGIAAILKTPAATNQGFQSLIIKGDSDVEFVYYLLHILRTQMLSLASGSTFLELSPSKLASISFSLPPLPEQRAIAHVLSVMDSDISLLEQKREKMKAVKQGMMHDLLTGRIRLTE
jgi:type I restriction enzyme S subunit